MKYTGTNNWRVKESNNLYIIEREFIYKRFLKKDKLVWSTITKTGDVYIPGEYAIKAIKPFGSLFRAKMMIEHVKDILYKTPDIKIHNI